MTLSFRIMEEILNVLDEDEIHDYKAIRRNAEKNMKDHAYKAKQFERRSDKAIEQGRERKAEVLYDKANDEWDQETREQQRAAQAHNRVEQLRKYSRNEALEIIESLKGYILKKDLEENPDRAMVSDKRMKQYEKADELKRKAFGQIVDNAGGLRKFIDSKRDITKNKEGEEKTDSRRGFLDQERVEINRENDPQKERAIEKSIKRHNKKVQEALDIMEEILNVVDEDIHDAIEKHVKDPKKKEELHDKAFDNYVQDDVDQQDRIEKKLTGGKEGNIEAWEKAFDIKRSHDVTKNIKGETKTDMRSGIHRVAPNVERDKDEFREQEKEYRRNKLNKSKSQNINCALDIMEQICDFADNLFELDIENKQNISPNKISKVKKDKDGKDVEVVSVADELFPHDGTAKQQFDKKILDKINDMIEGTGSLEDLIQFVRKGVANKKLAHEGLSEGDNLVNTVWRFSKNHKMAGKKRNRLLDKAIKVPSHNDYHADSEDRAVKIGDPTKGFSKRQKGDMDNTEKQELKRGERWTIVGNQKRDEDQGFPNAIKKSVERHNKKVAEALEILEDIHDAIRKSNKSAKEKSELSTKAMTTQGKELVDTAKREGKLATDIMIKRSPYNTKNANGERHTNTRRERIPFNDNCNLKAHESAISERKNIFGHEEGNRGDLIDDISQTVTGKTLNQHIENKVVKPVKRVGEAFELMEEIINELSVSATKWREACKPMEDRAKEMDDEKKRREVSYDDTKLIARKHREN